MLVVPILLLSAAAACNESLQPAILALRQNDPQKALAILDPLRSACAQSSDFYEVLGLANELSGKQSIAEEALRKAVELDPKSTRLLTELGATYLKNGKAAEAGKVLDHALTLDPSNPVTIKYAIGAAVQSRAWQRAAVLFQQIRIQKNLAALQQDPILVVWLAQTLIETNQRDRIDSLLSPQRQLMPPGLLFSLGTLFAQHRMYKQAVEYLRLVPAESADDALYFNMGLAYSHLQRFDQARDCYFRAIDKHAGHIDAYLHVGLDYAASGDLRIAIPWLFRAHSLAPDRTDIAYALAEQLIALEYFNTAKEVIDQALEAHLRDGLIIVVDGDLNLAKGDVAAATACYEKARAEQPKLAAALVGLAQAKASQGKDLEAKALLKDALSADPENPIVNGEAGLLEARSGDWNAALEHLNRAWAQDHSDTKIALELARTYRRRNKPQDALRLLSSFSPDMRTSSAFHLELAQIYTQLHRISEAQAERDAVNNLQAQAHDALHFENPRTYVH